jgi:NAD(P)-dependent dehydrogenase (short-subunit alcohol dehydrogenase family)
LGRAMAETFAERGESVIVTSRDRARADAVAGEIGRSAVGLVLDLAQPEEIQSALAGVGEVDHIVITAIHQALNSVAKFSIADAVHAATVKLVGYTEAVRVMRDRLRPNGSIVLRAGSPSCVPTPGRP